MLDYLLIEPVPGGPGWWPPITYPWTNPKNPAPKFYFSEQRGPVPDPRREGPDPMPWAVAFLLSAVSSKVAAANMTNQTAAQQIIAGANQAITAFIDSDDICPPWPFPGPPPWLSIIASQLTLVANSLQAGALQAGILQVAGQVLDRVALNPQPLTKKED
jgi:hypothetical protein